ncbi:MAG TPA: hypothetical protein VK001_14125 [Geminicoccaceae bacterium]|nr:hypothetical protein [Geminicoccaceae bacterium]
MARPLARDAEDFARLMLQTTERLGRDGGWVRATDAFERTLSEHPDHPWVAQVREKPTRRIALSAAVERLRVAEFPHIERRKTGNRRNAPVSYRIGRPGSGLELKLPYQVAPSHPLLAQRRADANPGEPASARRAALTEGSPTSPWRRRLLLRPATIAGDLGPWPELLRATRTRLLGAAATIGAGLKRLPGVVAEMAAGIRGR